MSSSDDLAIYLYLSLCALAAFSEIFVLTFYTIYINFSRNFACRLIVFSSLIDASTWLLQLFYCVFSLVAHRSFDQHSPEVCSVLAYFSNFLMLLTIIFSLLIPLSVYIQVLYRKDPSRYEKYYYICSVFYAILFTSLPLAISKQAFRDLDLRCWIKAIEMKFLAFYSHLFFAFLLGIFFLVQVLRTLKHEVFKDLEKTLIKKLSGIPIICMIFWVFPAMFSIFSTKEAFADDIVYFLFMPMQGLANSIVYGNINDEVRKKIMALITLDCRELRIKKKNSTIQSSIDARPKFETQDSTVSHSEDIEESVIQKFEIEIRSAQKH